MTDNELRFTKLYTILERQEEEISKLQKKL